jgi:hypothetical protein
VAENRQSVLDQLGNLRTPNAEAARVVSLLQQAMIHSIEADRHYRDWLITVRPRPGSCSLPENSDFELARQEDGRATAAKGAFVSAFNPLARRFRLRTWSEAEI